MRLLRAFLAAALVVGAASQAAAEAGDPRPVRSETPAYRLVRVIVETHQALLFDKHRGTHVLVDVGDAIGDFDVVEIDADQVVLVRPGEGREYVLVAGESEVTSRVVDPYPTLPPPPPGKITFSAAMLLDPYPDPAEEVLRTVQAPEEQRAPEVEEPSPDEVPREVEAPPPPPPPRDQSFTVGRAELDAALDDFDAIAASVEMALVDGGVELITVKERSFFHKMGLRDGDLVRSVDGTVLRGLDDAAEVYARLAKATSFAVEVTRGGAELTLRYKISAK